MTRPRTSQSGSLAGVSPPTGRTLHIALCSTPTPGCRVQGPSGAAWESPGRACWPLPDLHTPALRGPEGCQTHLGQTGWSHLLESLAPNTGNLRQQWQEEAGSTAGVGVQSRAPTLLLLLLWWGVLPSSLVLQVLVDGSEAEEEVEEPRGGLYQVRHVGSCPAGLTTLSVGWGRKVSPPSAAPPCAGPVLECEGHRVTELHSSLQVDGCTLTDGETEARLRPHRQETAGPGLQG